MFASMTCCRAATGSVSPARWVVRSRAISGSAENTSAIWL